MVVKSVYLLTSLVVGFIVSLAFSESAFGAKIQPVYSLKNLGDGHQDASGNAYKKLQIKCNTGPEPRYIHRTKGSKLWCVNGDANECSEERIDAATRACVMGVDSIVSKVASTTSEPAAPSAAQLQARAERKKLEDELITNRQQTIALRERQLVLRKRELELQQERDLLN